MNPERRQQIERIYHMVLKLDAGRRASFIKEVSGGDDELRRAVESLLTEQEEKAGITHTPARE